MIKLVCAANFASVGISIFSILTDAANQTPVNPVDFILLFANALIGTKLMGYLKEV